MHDGEKESERERGRVGMKRKEKNRKQRELFSHNSFVATTHLAIV